MHPETKKLTDTYYSSDYTPNHTSFVIIYDKEAKDLKDNHIKRDIILAHPYKTRCEFKLYNSNTQWLHWDNLRGNYDAIFKRYKRYLAMLYVKHLTGCIQSFTSYNPHFAAIKEQARQELGQRLTRTRLKQRNVLQSACTKAELERTRQEKLDKIEVFMQKKKNIEKARNMAEMTIQALEK
jgi:hypothetical protein